MATQGATQIQIERADRWKSQYVRVGDEEAEFVSRALADPTVSQ